MIRWIDAETKTRMISVMKKLVNDETNAFNKLIVDLVNINGYAESFSIPTETIECMLKLFSSETFDQTKKLLAVDILAAG